MHGFILIPTSNFFPVFNIKSEMKLRNYTEKRKKRVYAKGIGLVSVMNEIIRCISDSTIVLSM